MIIYGVMIIISWKDFPVAHVCLSSHRSHSSLYSEFSPHPSAAAIIQGQKPRYLHKKRNWAKNMFRNHRFHCNIKSWLSKDNFCNFLLSCQNQKWQQKLQNVTSTQLSYNML